MKTIEITVSPRGETKVETRGFSGGECREASRFVEQALGTRSAETLTAEFYQEQQSGPGTATGAGRCLKIRVSRARTMPDAVLPPGCPATIEIIARAIRRELGEEVDAYPGRRSPEGADPLNRAFGAIVRSLLASGGVLGEDLAVCVSRMLLHVAYRRLEAEGWGGLRAKALIEDEPGSPDDWLIFLILSSRPQIEPLLDLGRG